MSLITSTDFEFTVLGSFSTARAGEAVDLGGKLQRSVLALESLTRGYTTEECATYGIDPCPTTLAQVMQRYGGSA